MLTDRILFLAKIIQPYEVFEISSDPDYTITIEMGAPGENLKISIFNNGTKVKLVVSFYNPGKVLDSLIAAIEEAVKRKMLESNLLS